MENAPLPGWLVAIVLLTLAFATGYWYWVDSLRASPGPLDRYIAARAAAGDTGGEVTAAGLVAMSKDELSVRAGAEAYGRYCARCHGDRGEGDIGPNLTDDHWKTGGSPLDIYGVITKGRPRDGMPPWGARLGPILCQQITAYLLTIQGTHVPGKPPEGEKWEPPPEDAAAE